MNNILDNISSLRNHDKHSRLSISPNELDPLSIIFCICLFIVRTIKHSLGFGTPFAPSNDQSGVPAQDRTQDEQLFNLPDISLSMPLRPTAYHNQVFLKAVGAHEDGFTDLTANNAQLCLYLAALSEPAMLLLLAKRGCPIRPLGAVNVRNRFELLEPELCRSIFRHLDDSASSASEEKLTARSDLSVLSRFPRQARSVRRGIEIDVEVSIVVNESGNSSAQVRSKPIFRQDFTMLQFMEFSDRAPTKTFKQSGQPETQHMSESASVYKNILLGTVFMTKQAPHAWAELCKDYNPIHFSPILAKILGQPGQLAHGNHAVGICIESMDSMLGFRVTSSAGTDTNESGRQVVQRPLLSRMRGDASDSKSWRIEVRFRRPIVLPASIGPKIHENNDGLDIVDDRTGKVSIEVVVGNPSS